jgi:predicted MFS family arabinose efflux permease
MTSWRPRPAGGSHRSLYLLIAACVTADVAIVPLLPGLRASQGLSATESGLLLSAGTAAMTVAPVPLGRLADRLGPARLVTAAGTLATAASLLLAADEGFPALLLGRCLIGVTTATIWTAGPALVADRPAAVTRAIGAGGAGLLCGPLLAGVLADAAGARAAFAAAALLTLLATLIFRGAHRAGGAPPAAGARLRPALRHPRVRAAALGLLLLGSTRGAADLLAPAELHGQGLSASGIGTLATLAAAVAVLAAVLARRLVERHDAMPLAAAAAVALGAAWLIPVAAAGTPALAGFLVAAAAARTLLNPASYVLAREGAVATGAGTAVTLGATNVVLGGGGLAGPLAASLALARPRLAFAATALLCLAAAAVIARAGASSPRPARLPLLGHQCLTAWTGPAGVRQSASVAPPPPRRGGDGMADPGVPPRAEDLFRHLDDLRTDSYEGSGPRAERIERFHRAVDLLDPVVRRVLQEADTTFLAGSGELARHGPAVEQDGGWTARWELSWPEQRAATPIRGGVDRVGPVQVVAWFAATFTHPHLAGSSAGHWPLQVTGEADAERQEPIVRAIVEAELHQRVFEGGWRILPGYPRRSAGQ